MKTKLIITVLLALTFLFSVGQTVPNTTTFTLQNVVDAVNPTTDDLVDSFADAVSDYFNDTYSGSKNGLLNFRDYGPHNGCPVYISSGSLASQTASNNLSVSYPAANAGEFLIIVAAHYSSSVMSASGWTSLYSHTYSSYRETIFYKHLTANEASGSVSITSTDYITKFAVAHRIRAISTNTISAGTSALALPTNTYITATLNGTTCNLGMCIASLFISQSLGVSPGTGWTTNFNNWTSGIGASAILTYSFSSTSTAPTNTFSFTGQVPLGYVNLMIQ